MAVHPVARRAAAYDDVADGLQAKFSIPYLVAYVVLHGEPGPDSFDGVDPGARALAAERVRLRDRQALREAEAVWRSTAKWSPASRRRAGRPRRRWTRTSW